VDTDWANVFWPNTKRIIRVQKVFIVYAFNGDVGRTGQDLILVRILDLKTVKGVDLKRNEIVRQIYSPHLKMPEREH
jgi:hypothetical protein